MLAWGMGFALTAINAAALLYFAVCRRRERRASARLGDQAKDLEKQALLLQSTLENIDEGLSVFDREGRLIAWNSRMGELLDLASALSRGATVRDLLTRQAMRGDFGEVDLESEVESRLDAFYRDLPLVKERVTAAGRVLQIRRRAMPDGGVITTYSDITEIKAWERKLIRARSQAELANRTKSDFLANMSHELRTPLNAIIGFSEVIINEIFGEIENPKYLEYLKDIHNSSLHLLSIINDVLDMSKIEAGRLELCKDEVNIGDILRDAVRMLQKRATMNDIKVSVELPQGDVEVWADERAIKQVVLNLLSNAVKFSNPDGTVRVRAIRDRPGEIVVEIEDHGIGMSGEEQQRALQPFGQAKPATTRRYGGTGLGLPISKGLVEAHGGSLTITSSSGCGTLVRVALPIHEAWLASDVSREAMIAADRLDR